MLLACILPSWKWLSSGDSAAGGTVVSVCLPASSLLAFSLQGPGGKSQLFFGRTVAICLVCISGESLCGHSRQLYCAVFRIVILMYFRCISEASLTHSDLGKLGSLQQRADTVKRRAHMKGEIVPLTAGPSAPKARVFLSSSPPATITGNRRLCACWIQWIINFRSPSRSPALYLP